MEAAFNDISENAERLYADAKLMSAMRRYPTALSLAVLAVEEAGKCFMMKTRLHDTTATKSGKRMTHRQKQAVLGRRGGGDRDRVMG